MAQMILNSGQPMRGVDMVKPRLLLCALALVMYFAREQESTGRGFEDSSVAKVTARE
jgi:hypothetical protein